MSTKRGASLRERAGRVVFAALGRRRFHRLIAAAQSLKAVPRDPAQLAAISDAVERFHVASYEHGVLNDTYWFGVPIQKSPLDCWTYQEIIHEQRPDLIVETGTYLGGSALFFAHLFDILGRGRVLTIDLQLRGHVDHPRVTQLEGDTLSPGILTQVEAAVAGAKRVLVVLDDDHSAAHVLRELPIYGRFVTPGSYMVVEDTNVNGHPVFPEHGPGPLEAVREFLRTDRSFEVDRSREKFLLTYFPEGWLRKRA